MTLENSRSDSPRIKPKRFRCAFYCFNTRMSAKSLLIQKVEIDGVSGLDVLCHDGFVQAIGRDLTTERVDSIVDANHGALLRGLHDRHIHIFSLAASRSSVSCGPPQVTNEAELIEQLRKAPGVGWIRGIEYHESVAEDLTRARIDEFCSTRPIRIQHRSGKLWVLNTLACAEVGLSRESDGQLFRKDAWLRRQLKSSDLLFDDIHALSKELASYGVTHLTDASPSNDDATLELLQDLMPEITVSVMGNQTLATGERKLLLDDYAFPSFDEFCDDIRTAHEQNRNVAIHCVTQAEVVFALAALRTAGAVSGDRLEHASVADDACLKQMQELPITVVTQPSFVQERGDQYLVDVDTSEQHWLYRARSFIDAGVELAGGSDAPFGSPNPWHAISAAVDRCTVHGSVLNESERINADEAVALFAPGNIVNRSNILHIDVGDPANLCVLRKSWRAVTEKITTEDVLFTLNRGSVTFDGRNSR